MSNVTKRGFGALLILLLIGGIRGPDAASQETFSSRCGAGVHADEGSALILLPQGRLFCPLAADPKAERSFASYLRGDFATIADPEPGEKTNIGAVGLGDSFAIFRRGGGGSGGGVQLDLAGAIFAQFNLDRPSFDLINADYLVGLPLTFRREGFSGRLRIYHQSSHLGDEFLLSREPELVNLSFESAELILSQEMGPLRLSGGGEKFFRREPEGLPPHLLHTGAEIRPAVFGDGRLLAAVDLKAVDDADWELGWSARAGVEIARIPSPGHPPRVISLTGEFYDGPAPYGQFYREDIQYWGFAFSLTL
ncbi:MAG: DUF1207 domain-containing protein [Gemmatimonadetes bacterium]|nr:DUF1207 domain-containing protein [Gemmatimonadota bacterium]NIR79104.1 DUF1207 domain-containing protein [Gemmatimonadota bacterium]NIT87759.1 DUF1207 domain-containing protein [Gemmatimonadota bacterium]NIU31619.1 DUF1207 domain-containing protein [Gemmatimonadota bacterium]NIU36253.1 DUF1207 domain-containing protein [Gemmatimonadota bacterium]